MAFTDVVKIATDANYDAGAETWSATPTKTSLNASVLAKGLIPKQGLYAQYFNYMLNNAQSTIEVIQSMLKFLSTDLSISLDDADDDFLSNAIADMADTRDAANLVTANAYADGVGDATEVAVRKLMIKQALCNIKENYEYGGGTDVNTFYSISKIASDDVSWPRAIAVGYKASQPIAIQSDDLGLTWTHKTVTVGTGSTNRALYCCSYSGPATPDYFVALGESGLIFSTTSFTQQTAPGSYTGTYVDVIWFAAASLFVAIGTGGAIHTSPTGVTWTARTYPSGTTGDPVCIACNDTRIVIRTTSGDAITSTNGTSYNRQDVVAGGDPDMGGLLCWDGTYFVCLSQTTISRSVDGTSGSWVAGGDISSYFMARGSPSYGGYLDYRGPMTLNSFTGCLIAAGGGDGPGDATIVISFDHGDTWEQINAQEILPNATQLSFTIHDIFITSDNRILGCGGSNGGSIHEYFTFASPALGQGF